MNILGIFLEGPNIGGALFCDGTVRLRTVGRDTNADYWRAIRALGYKTGRPMILNNSSKIRGEPIVDTPLEASRCYF